MEGKAYRTAAGTVVAPEEFRITILEEGPYLVYGRPPLVQQFIMLNRDGDCWRYQEADHFPMESEPVALCRCGASKNAPFCDGAHQSADWNPAVTAPVESSIADGADVYEGPELTLTDNVKYCALMRFCEARRSIWNLVEESDEAGKRDMAIREANHCASGRLTVWNRRTGKPYELPFKPSICLIEDPDTESSGPLWVRGGIPVSRQDGATYEVRNRVTLCRCGHSSNKPFCDCSHADVKYDDGLVK